MLNDQQREQLVRMTRNVGDLGFRRRVFAIVEALDVQRGDSILDCGCGEGFYVMILAHLYDCTIIAFDWNATLTEKAAAWLTPEVRHKVQFVNGDIKDGLPFPDNHFDKVIASEVLEHLDDDAAGVRALYRVAKQGATVAITVPSHYYPFFWDPLNWIREALGLGHFNPKNCLLGGIWSYDHKRLYYPKEIFDLCTLGGFSVERFHGVIHSTIPFTQNMLYLGKQLYSRVNRPILNARMEKFQWTEESHVAKKGILDMTFSLFLAVDRRNDRPGADGLHRSQMGYFLRLKKE